MYEDTLPCTCLEIWKIAVTPSVEGLFHARRAIMTSIPLVKEVSDVRGYRYYMEHLPNHLKGQSVPSPPDRPFQAWCIASKFQFIDLQSKNIGLQSLKANK